MSCGMLRRMVLVRTDVLDERCFIIRMTRIGELGTTLAVNWQPTHAAKKDHLRSVCRLQEIPQLASIACNIRMITLRVMAGHVGAWMVTDTACKILSRGMRREEIQLGT
jgi:hypothetical protein